MRHFFSVDVEEHFHAHALEHALPRSSWDEQPSRVAEATDRLLDLLARHGVRGTFFVLGWVAKRSPDLVKRIAAAGHEIGSHTWSHPKISTLTPAQFREELDSSKAILEDLSGQLVIGFRAPSFSILPGMEWAFDTLLEAGFTYDSSVFPIRRPGYGWPGAPTGPYAVSRPAGSLTELPMTTLALLGGKLPASGGAYLRHFPLGVILTAFTQCERRGAPAMLYVHPWEVDPDQPRVPVSTLTRLRHYGGIERTMPRLERMLGEFEFGSVRDWLARR
ncbi:MAG TPA: XrtA system polysaccharide deacetylase [Gemmatimonadales bacterium]|nr:XrtA system polysaccharide deacetylase [Gemmatimonadales bacterium]